MNGRAATWPALVAVARHLPDEEVASSDVERRVSASSPGYSMVPGLIERTSGVRSRHVAPPGVTSSDLASEAVRLLLDVAGCEPDSVDVLIYASASHDVAEPATANMVQVKSGCGRAAVVDVKNACNSFVNALDFAAAYVETGRARRIVIASGEVLTPAIDWCVSDGDQLVRKFAAFTLGDGAGACLVEARHAGDARVFAGSFMSDGSHWDASTILSGGTLMWGDASRMHFECDTGRLQALAVEHVPAVARRALDTAGWEPDDIDLVVPHQVSLSVILRIADAVGFEPTRCVVTLDRVGNTAAASIPIALSVAQEEGRLRTGARVLLIGGAAGFSVGVVPVVW
jgi:3-oxoacyl-(acyl-carrier-protein) synthase III